MGKRVAIVGSGSSGMGALWALNTSTDHEVHLFEVSSRLGGDTNSVTFEGPNGDEIEVDVGLTMMNTATYPNFLAFLGHLGLSIQKGDLTFSVSRDQGTLEWATTSLKSIFSQWGNLIDLGIWRMLFDIVRFNEFAPDLLRSESESKADPQTQPNNKGIPNEPAQGSIGEYLDKKNYSQEFQDNYLLPMTAALWRTNPNICLQFPAITLVRFMYQYHLLNTTAERSSLLSIPGGSKGYIDAVLRAFPQSRMHVKSRVTALEPTETGSIVLTANGKDQEFDHVILAIPADQALKILQPTAKKEEVEILGGFQTTRNVVVLHSDLTLMPKRRVLWSALNYIMETPFPPTKSQNISQMCLTYCMNMIQGVPEDKFGPILVTLNPLNIPDPRLAQGIWEYAHPLYNAAAIRFQGLLPRIQATRNISYCGSWTRFGFLEDGFSSGLSVAVDHLGAHLPFGIVDPAYSREKRPTPTIKNHLLRVIILMVQIMILLMERAWFFLESTLAGNSTRQRKIA
ncbi:hypothetical protein EDD37DRAFT_419052 [Exophiala viscosa]|uniref:Amine oxidase domain-containing protein n=1 Tax=Exophiala viscosa TaxID=2486360 RepID=A0AAN6DTD1_9EURO|nr:hypothetical protein EDD36DRAFT_300018 [Exophiala viscosa]KAI1623382.1 hypothetical protein EDD37DRAFT_419052 [Exophiala viscosa]